MLWADLFPETVLHTTCHLPGELNIADLGTRDETSPNEINQGSLWQTGPEFLQLPKESWPLTDPSTLSIPNEELLPRHHRQNALSLSPVHSIFDTIKGFFKKSWDLSKCVGPLARWLKASKAAARVPGGWSCEKNKDEIMRALAAPISGEDYQ